VFLAFREIRRARWRFALLAGSVGLLVFLILFVQGLSGALIRQFIGAIDNQSADVLVYSAQARKSLEGSVVAPGTVARVAAVPGVAAAGRLGEGTFSVRAGGERQDAVLIGYELGHPGRPTTLVDGRAPQRDFEAVASETSRAEGFALGDEVRLERGGRAIRIVGVARDANYSVLPTLFTTYHTYEQARLDANPQASRVFPSAVAVQTAPGASARRVARAVNARVPGVEALTRAEAVADSPGVASVSESIGLVVLLCYFVVIVVAGLFFLILTVQKAPALTLLRALGVRTAVLARALVWQVAAVVAAGIVVGAVLGGLALQVSGSNLGARLDAASVVRTGVLVLVLAVVASTGALRRVLRIDPVRATMPGGTDL
jgi:putative ABC transport system permease protein